MKGLIPRLIGAILGLILGIIILWPHVGWRLVVLAVLILLGYLIGRYFQTNPEIRERLREFVSQLFR